MSALANAATFPPVVIEASLPPHGDAPPRRTSAVALLALLLESFDVERDEGVDAAINLLQQPMTIGADALNIPDLH